MLFLELIPTRVKADSFQGFQNGASGESCPSASATGPMHDAQCGLVLLAQAVERSAGSSGQGARCCMVVLPHRYSSRAFAPDPAQTEPGSPPYTVMLVIRL